MAPSMKCLAAFLLMFDAVTAVSLVSPSVAKLRSAEKGCGAWEEGVSLEGRELSHSKTPSAAACCELCGRTVGEIMCEGWTWNLGNHLCYLKNGITGKFSHPCVSGYGPGPRCGPVKMDANYTNERFKFKDISIAYGDEYFNVTGLATGDPSNGCPGCSKPVFVQIFNTSSSSYVGVNQIRCDHGGDTGFQSFIAQYNLPAALFEGHNFELRASNTWSFCDTFKGNFDPQAGYGSQHGKFAGINCAPKPHPKFLQCPEVGGSTKCCLHKVAADNTETCSSLSKFYDTPNLRILHGDGETICSDKFAPPQPKEKLRVCPSYACAKDACIGGEMMPKSNGTLSKIDCDLQCKRPATRT